MAVTVVSWNIAKREEPWRQLARMDADVALLQEAAPPPDDVLRLSEATLPSAGSAYHVDIGPRESWDSHVWNSNWYEGRFDNLYDRWAMVVKLSKRVEVEWLKQVSPIGWVEQDELAVSGIGTIAAARVIPLDGTTEPFIVASMYARWVGTHPRVKTAWGFGFADSSVHRIISDLSAFIGHEDPRRHRILATGTAATYTGSSLPFCVRQDGCYRNGVCGATGAEWSSGGHAVFG